MLEHWTFVVRKASREIVEYVILTKVVLCWVGEAKLANVGIVTSLRSTM